MQAGDSRLSETNKNCASMCIVLSQSVSVIVGKAVHGAPTSPCHSGVLELALKHDIPQMPQPRDRPAT